MSPILPAVIVLVSAAFPALPCPSNAAALCEHRAGIASEAAGRNEEAIAHYRAALAATEPHATPTALQVFTLTNLGDLYRRRHRTAEAETALAAARQYAQPLASSDPELYAIVLSRSGTLYSELDRLPEARAMLDEAIATLRKMPEPDAAELAYSRSSLGMLDLNAGRYKVAEASLREAVTLATGSLGENDPETAAHSTNLALALLIQGKYARAELLLRRARFVIETHYGPDSPQLVNVLAETATVETALGKFSLAEDCDRKALAILTRDTAYSPELVLIQVNLATLYVRQHRTAEAEAILPQAVAAEREYFAGSRPLADGLRDLAELRAQQHLWSGAASLFQEAIGIYETRLGADHPDLAPVLIEYATVLKRLGAAKDQVRSLEARAKAIGNAQA